MATCSYPDCSREAWPASTTLRCFYHAENNGDKEDDARRFWAEARQCLADGRCDFAGWHFPECPDGDGFEGCTLKAADFTGATFVAGNFTEAHLLGATRFDKATFQGNVFFSQAKFDGAVSFASARFAGLASFEDAHFASICTFDRATFAGTANFPDARFGRSATFTAATFTGLANFDHCRFGSVRFGQANFNLATFRWACFEQEAYFRQARFVQGDFRSASLEDCEFSGASVGEELIFSPPSPPLPFHRSSPFRHPENGEVAYRLAKQAAQGRGDYRAAGEYHYAEQCAIESGRRRRAEWRPWRRGFWGRQTNVLWCWFEFLLARALFGYGERPARVLLAGLLVIVLWAAMYYGMQAMGPGELCGGDLARCHVTFAESLHFSAVTFTTVGYGDFKPKPGFRFVADSEAIVGAALMAMFVVALTRKYMR